MTITRHIVQAIGSSPIARAADDRLVQTLLEPDSVHPELDQLIFHLTQTDMQLLELIVSNADLVTKHGELVGQIVASAYRVSHSVTTRSFIRRIAHKAGLHRWVKDESNSSSYLTDSQANVLAQLRAYAELYFDKTTAATIPIKLRLNPLIVGPSGVGKSHLVATLGRTLGIPVLRVSLGDWIVLASRVEPCSLEILQRELDQHDRLILHIDELDKLRSQEAYGLSQQAEIFNVLDRARPYHGNAKRPWTATHDRKLRDSVMIIGSGTWENLWSRELGRRVGFVGSDISDEDIATAINKSALIPPELLKRFSTPILALRPYRTTDFERIAEQLNLSAGDFSPAEAAASGLNFRFLESHLTTRALVHARGRAPVATNLQS